MSVDLTILQKKLGLGEQNPPCWLERDRAEMGSKAGHCPVKPSARCPTAVFPARRTLLLFDREGESGNSRLEFKQLTAQIELWIPMAPLGRAGGVLREG